MLGEVQIKTTFLCQVCLESRVEIIELDNVGNGESSLEQQRVSIIIYGEILGEAL